MYTFIILYWAESLAPSFAQKDGRAGFVFLYDWSSILFPFLIPDS